MATKRVLDGSALSGRDDDDDAEYTQDNQRLQEEEPIDVFNPVNHGGEVPNLYLVGMVLMVSLLSQNRLRSPHEFTVA